jgi:hypothetical protein
VLANLIHNAKQDFGEAIQSAYYGSLALLLAVVAAALFTVAAYVWLYNEYGAVIASAGVGGLYLFLAICVSIVGALKRRARAREREATERAKQALAASQQNLLTGDWLTNPAVLATGVDLTRKLLARTDAQKLAVPALVLIAALVIALRRVSHSA